MSVTLSEAKLVEDILQQLERQIRLRETGHYSTWNRGIVEISMPTGQARTFVEVIRRLGG